MDDLQTVLDSDRLAALRVAYDPALMTAAMSAAVNRPYPALSPWNDGIESTFYGTASPLAPIDRERCLIALLTLTGPQLSLAVHVYWGLMEGLSVPQVCHTIGLAASYGGVPRIAYALPTVERVLRLLDRLSAIANTAPLDVLTELLAEFSHDG